MINRSEGRLNTLLKFKYMNEIDKQNARVEYSATQDAYLHYDNFTWQVGAVLIAGIFVYWGFIISNPTSVLVILLGNLVICLLMSCWLLYAEHNRQIYLFKLHRIHELEKQLGFLQHRRFKEWHNQKRVYILNQPVGHYLDYIIYVIVTTGGLAPGLLVEERKWYWYHWILLWLTILIVVTVFLRVHYVDKKTKIQLKELEKNENSLQR